VAAASDNGCSDAALYVAPTTNNEYIQVEQETDIHDANVWWFLIKNEVAGQPLLPETIYGTCRTTRRHIPEDDTLHIRYNLRQINLP
jgi:hypothetical protein